MKNLLLACFLLISSGGQSFAVTGHIPCIPIGGSVPIPANPDMTAPGMPVDATVVGLEWFDQDLFSQQDMGGGNPLILENKGGNLSGLNGDVVNGGLDGS